MAFLRESSQQHALCDITETLMDLRRLVAAHGEFLAKFGQRTLTEEPPDSLNERSPPHLPWHTRPPDHQPVAAPPRCWTLPPSITQPPLGVKAEAIPRLHFDPPRFDGDNALDWIQKIQNYYNHQYMPLHDRLYLTQFLFDHPTSEWMAYWEENNKDKGWDDFLCAVKQRFDPDTLADYAGPVRKAHTSTSDLLTWSEAPAPAVSSTANVVRADQPVVEVCKVLIDGHMTGEDAEILYKRKPCSGYSLKEMNDSGEGSIDSRAYDDNFKCRTSNGIVKRAPIIAEDGGNPRLLQKQKFACFDESSGGDDAAHMNQGPMSRQQTPCVAGETVRASKIPVNPIRHTPQNALSTRTWRLEESAQSLLNGGEEGSLNPGEVGSGQRPTGYF